MTAFHQGIGGCEAQWQIKIRSERADKTGRFPLLTVCGPSGVGKTTIVGALADTYPVYIETTEGNPHLKSLLEGKDDFNAAASQEWFLHSIGKHIASANPRCPLILDQDPSAIVLAYSRVFQEDGLITEAHYTSLLQRLLQIEEMLQRWRAPRIVLFLDAPAEVLHQRVLQRWGGSRTPPFAWFNRIRASFRDLFPRFPDAITVSTVDLSPEQVILRARSLVENRAGGAQA